ncbi:hypothetical protein [Tepidibacter thalassicus]|uniref:Uncharacterized protein n=1 Tax=Tepidibacter thalassicus DSM 15285 TaxID=1123350 RepID=A0A1M5PX91_9FIRM|nr:hypothetical protein [Tepidibacter thalassicus]SHH06414.1 hypothetical protein SAMN02744040_00658 [Tepidibacter thalassicus DSM 15285]
MYVITNIKQNKEFEVLKEGLVFSCKAKELVSKLKDEVAKREKALRTRNLKGFN